MRITKHFQSCLVVAADDRGTVGIDLGARPHGPLDLDELGQLDAVLYTHRHGDHLDVGLVGGLLDRGVSLYGNADVRQALAGHPVQPIDDGDAVTVAGWQVTAHDLPHAVMVDGGAGPPNTGFLLDGRLFHPGDGLAIEGVDVDVLALPIAGPSISMHDAWMMVQHLAPSVVVPIHYDVFVADPHRFASSCDLARVVVLDDGESVSL